MSSKVLVLAVPSSVNEVASPRCSSAFHLLTCPTDDHPESGVVVVTVPLAFFMEPDDSMVEVGDDFSSPFSTPVELDPSMASLSSSAVNVISVSATFVGVFGLTFSIFLGVFDPSGSSVDTLVD